VEAPVLRLRLTDEERRLLLSIQDRLLWLTANTIHHANSRRASPSPERVGGHQSSSMSSLTLLTALYFKLLRPGDRIAVKPTAAPVFYAIQVLRGLLPPEGLRAYRSLGGLQAYPSRVKNPDWFDFSTGSMGLGAVAPAFAALMDRYLRDRFGGAGDAEPGQAPAAGRLRNIALVGDAELDEGSVWEAWTEEAMADLAGHVVVVDLNRQSLDRVVGDHRSRQLERLFRALGWHVVSLRFGRRLAALFAERGGEWLRGRLEAMENLEYHALLRLPPAAARKALGEGAPPETVARLEALGDAEVATLLADLGGHDLDAIVDAFAEADEVTDRPAAILAWTLKGWRLPFAGTRRTTGAQLTGGQLAALRRELGVAEDDEWAPFPPGSPRDATCGASWAKASASRGAIVLRRPRYPRSARPSASADDVDAGRPSATSWPLSAGSQASTPPGHRVCRRGDHDICPGGSTGAASTRRARTTPSSATGSGPHSLEGIAGRPAPRAGDREASFFFSCPSWVWPRALGRRSYRSARSTTASCRAASTLLHATTRRRASSSSPALSASASPRGAPTSRC
jgi:pyruvate dehydrogenase E1 component